MSSGLTIGEFSRSTHLSVKTLRHYHEVGLLEPSFVNPGNGYRHYVETQIPVAQVIRRLRDLEMPVADVKAVVAASDSDARNALIAAHLDRLEADLAQTREAVSSLRNLITRPETALEVVHRTVGPTPAIAIHDVVQRGDILSWWQGALGELYANVQAQGLNPTGPSGGVYESDLYLHERGGATVFIPVDGSARAVGRVQAVVVPATELAIATHHGSLADIDVTYGELGTHVAAHELSVEGPLRESYVRGAHETPDDDQWVTEIGWPIFRADATGGDPRGVAG
jgi:DNA-binding transcriptional MerR regulator/effector-binding domain-containing protein